MPRFALHLLSALFLFVAASASAAAQAPASVGMQTIAGGGYQYQAAGDWQQVPASLLRRLGPQSFNVDGEVASADGRLRAHVETATGFGITAATLPDALSSYFGGTPADGLAGGNSVSIFAGPDPTQVANAEAAVAGAASYADENGAPRVLAARMALRGQSAYLLTVDVTQDFYQSDPNFGRMMNSFRLTP